MKAHEMTEALGKRLIGRQVLTQAMGTWPGGLAKVLELDPDPNDDNIVMLVKPLAGQIDPDTKEPFKEMGIFWNEEISFRKR